MLEPEFYERYAEFYSARYGDFVRKIETVGPFTRIDALQSYGNLSGTTTNELLFVMTLSRSNHSVDFGNGLKREWWNPGDFAICPANFSNRVVSEQAHRLQIISIYAPDLRKLYELSEINFDNAFSMCHTRRTSDLKMKRIWAAFFHDSNKNSLLSRETLALELFHHLQNSAGQGRQLTTPMRERLGQRALNIAKERLCALDLPCPSLGELAALTNLSANHFCRAFKVETGMPPHRFHLVERINRARHMLIATRLSVAEIGTSLGFEDQSYFSRCFKRETGMTPSALRANVIQ